MNRTPQTITAVLSCHLAEKHEYTECYGGSVELLAEVRCLSTCLEQSITRAQHPHVHTMGCCCSCFPSAPSPEEFLVDQPEGANSIVPGFPRHVHVDCVYKCANRRMLSIVDPNTGVPYAFVHMPEPYSFGQGATIVDAAGQPPSAEAVTSGVVCGFLKRRRLRDCLASLVASGTRSFQSI